MRFCPGQAVNPRLRQAVGQRDRRFWRRRDRQRLFGERNGAETADAAGRGVTRRRIECDRLPRFDAIGGDRVDIGRCQRRSRKDARGGGAADDLGDRE